MKMDSNAVRLTVVGALTTVFALSIAGGTTTSSGRATKRQLLVAAKDADTVYRLEVKFTKKAKVKVKKEIKGFDGPAGIAISADEKFALVTNSGGNSVSRVNVKKGKITSTSKVGDTPTDVVLTRDNQYAFIANSAAATLSVYDVSQDKVIGKVKLPGNPLAMAMDPGGERAYVNTDANIMAVVNISDFVARTATPPYAQGDFTASVRGVDEVSFETTCLMTPGMSVGQFTANLTSLLWTCNHLFAPSSAGSMGVPLGAAPSTGRSRPPARSKAKRAKGLKQNRNNSQDDKLNRPRAARAFAFDVVLFDLTPPTAPGHFLTEISQDPPHVNKQGVCTSATIAYTRQSFADPSVFESVLWNQPSGVYVHTACGANCNIAKTIKKMATIDLASRGASNIVAAAMNSVPAGERCPQ